MRHISVKIRNLCCDVDAGVYSENVTFINKIRRLFYICCASETSLIHEGYLVTLIEDDLLTVLKELQEASLAMTSGKLTSASDMERYHRAIEWSKRVIELAEKSE
jgi:hypothetical protein